MIKRALVVEDDVNIAELLRLYLSKDGFEVMIVGDGGKASSAFDLFKADDMPCFVALQQWFNMQQCAYNGSDI